MNSVRETRTRQIDVHRLFFAIMLVCVLYLAGQTACFASTVVLQWDPNTDADLAGYKVYYQADSSTQPFRGIGANEGDSPRDVGNNPTATLSGLDPAHSYFFAVTAYNTSGVESAYSNIVSIPELLSPTISITSPVDNTKVSGTVSVSANASDNVGVTKVEFYVNGALKSTGTTTPYLYSWDTTSLAAGSYTLMAKAYDAAGNVGQSSSVSVTVNNTSAPIVSITSPEANATVSSKVMVNVSASDDTKLSKVKFYINNVLKKTVLSNNLSAIFSYPWATAGVSDGSYTLTAKAIDAAGNVGLSSVTVLVKNDTKAPKVSIISPIGNKTVGGKKTVTARVFDNRGVKKVEFYVDGELQTTDTASPWSFKWNTVSLTNTAHTLSAKAYDASGNIGESLPVSVTVSNENIAPTVSITSPTDDAIVSGKVNVKAGASDNVKVSKTEFYVNNVLKHTDSTASYSYSWVTTTLPNGSYTLTVKAYDSAGNVGQSTVAVTVGN